MSTDPTPARGDVLDGASRSAAFEAGAPRVPRRAIAIGAAVACALALGGTLLERLASSEGLNPPTHSSALTSSMASFLGLARLAGTPAPEVRLRDQQGHLASIAALRGKVVVLSFFNANCRDACRVLAAELAQANRLLGARRSQVELLTVNTDPLDESVSTSVPAVAASGLSVLPNWRFLSGSANALDGVWRNYGVAISVYRSSGLVVHNNVMYFVDPLGRLRLRTSPVADESARGTYSLPANEIRRSAAGIAAYATSLLGAPR